MGDGMVGILKNGKSDLILFNGTVNAVSYIDNAINDGMLPVFNANQNILLMHDNAPPHTALITRDHYKICVFLFLPGPPNLKT